MRNFEGNEDKEIEEILVEFLLFFIFVVKGSYDIDFDNLDEVNLFVIKVVV